MSGNTEWRLGDAEKRLDEHDHVQKQVVALVEWRISVDGQILSLQAKFTSIENWLRGLMGSVILALLLLVANLIVSYKK